ncbi:unnamed protein product, partial [Iphiclides podalirius]
MRKNIPKTRNQPFWIPFKINGILSKTSTGIRFHWSSWKCVYAFLSLTGQIFITIMCVVKVANSETTLNHQ